MLTFTRTALFSTPPKTVPKEDQWFKCSIPLASMRVAMESNAVDCIQRALEDISNRNHSRFKFMLLSHW